MGCLGVHFALPEPELEYLRSLPSEGERLEYITEEIENDYFENRQNEMAESDKAWDAMHRVLADGKLTWDGGEYPLNHVILAGELLYTKSDYIVSLKTPDQVRDIAAALPGIDESEFRQRYFEIDSDDYLLPLDEVDFQYTWEYFQDVRTFYLEAAGKSRYVLFTADQ